MFAPGISLLNSLQPIPVMVSLSNHPKPILRQAQDERMFAPGISLLDSLHPITAHGELVEPPNPSFDKLRMSGCLPRHLAPSQIKGYAT